MDDRQVLPPMTSPTSTWSIRMMLTALVAEHEALRTVFPLRDGLPVQEVRVAGPFTVESLSPHRVLGVDEERFQTLSVDKYFPPVTPEHFITTDVPVDPAARAAVQTAIALGLLIFDAQLGRLSNPDALLESTSVETRPGTRWASAAPTGRPRSPRRSCDGPARSSAGSWSSENSTTGTNPPTHASP